MLAVLDKTTDFDSLHKALNHKNLSKSARENWLKALEEQHAKQENTLKNHKQQVLHKLQSLKILACKHAITGIKESAYATAARTAFELYQALSKETTTLFSQKKFNLINYKSNCNKAIKKAEPILKTHRGYKQILLDIFNVILAYITFNPPNEERKWRFFEAETASMQQVKQAKAIIDTLSVSDNSISNRA